MHDRFLLCDGDTLFDCNLANLLADAATDDPMVVGRLAPGLNGGGIALFRKALLDDLPPGCWLDADAWRDLSARGLLRETVANGWFEYVRESELRILAPRPWLDCPSTSPSGSPPVSPVPQQDVESRAEAQAATSPAHDLAANDPIARLRRRSLFLDRDGVLNIDHGYIGSRDRFEWVDGALDAIRYATEAGWHVFVVTNQSGVGRGLYTEHDVQRLLEWMADEARGAGGTIDDVRFCPFHPEAVLDAYRQDHPWRKPSPGMLQDLIRTWELEPRRAVMVGDQPTDMQAAAAAGVIGHQFPGGNLLTFLRPILERFH